MAHLTDRTRDACDQLTRYGGAVADERVLAVLEALTDLNDNLCNGRDESIIREGVALLKKLLDATLLP